MPATCSGRYSEAAMMIMLRNRKRNESVGGSGSGGASARVSYCSSIRMCRCEEGTRRWVWGRGGRDGTGRDGGDERGEGVWAGTH